MRLMKAVVSLLIVFILLPTSIIPAATSSNSPAKMLSPLKNRYSDSFLLGNATYLDEMSTDSESLAVLTRHFNVVTPKNAMLPNALLLAPDVYYFEDADEFVNTAALHNMKVVGHTLIWHNNTPEWLNVNVSREEAIENLQNYIKTVVSHFGDSVYSWEVVNEAFYDQVINPENWRASLRQTPWYTAIGPDYIEIAFTAAKEANPNALLYYNDYLLDNPSKREAVYNMVKELKEKGVPIDGIGMQGKYGTSAGLNNIEDSIVRFSELDVTLNISELNLTVSAPFTKEKELKHSYRFAQLFQLFTKYSSKIERVTIWGLNDSTSPDDENHSAIFTESFEPKTAYDAIYNPQKFIEENADAADVRAYKLFAIAEYGSPSIIPSRFDQIWNRSNPLEIRNYLTDWAGARAAVSVLWSDTHLYVLADVEDRQLDNSSLDPLRQDSVAVFVNENYKDSSDDDIGMYVVNFNNEQSFGLNAHSESGFFSSAYRTETGYVIQMQIPFAALRPSHNNIIGFDIQINDAEFGDIISIARWNDLSGLSPDTNRLGKIILQKNPDKYAMTPLTREANDSRLPSTMLRTRIFLLFFTVIMMSVLCVLIYLTKRVKK